MADDPQFVPAVLDAMAPVAVAGRERKTARRKAKPDVRPRRCDAGGIEIEAEGVTIRVGRDADVAMIAAIVHALKASRRSARPELSG